MKKPVLRACGAVSAAVLALSLSACGHGPAPISTAQLAKSTSPSNHVSLEIRPEIEPASGFHTQTVITPYTEADVATVSVLLLDPASTGSPLAEEDLASGSFGDVVTFTDLAPNTSYEVLSRAVDSAGTQISLDASSSLAIVVTNDDQIGPLTLPVQLEDQIFSGTVTFDGVQIAPGQLVHEGSPSIVLSPAASE